MLTRKNRQQLRILVWAGVVVLMLVVYWQQQQLKPGAASGDISAQFVKLELDYQQAPNLTGCLQLSYLAGHSLEDYDSGLRYINNCRDFNSSVANATLDLWQMHYYFKKHKTLKAVQAMQQAIKTNGAERVEKYIDTYKLDAIRYQQQRVTN